MTKQNPNELCKSCYDLDKTSNQGMNCLDFLLVCNHDENEQVRDVNFIIKGTPGGKCMNATLSPEAEEYHRNSVVQINVSKELMEKRNDSMD